MDVQKLAKVLALAASDNEAEALHALRTASRLLSNAGLDFVALADRLSESGPVPSTTRMEDLEDTLFDLRNEMRHLRSENERLRQGHGTSAAAAPNLADSAALIRLRMELDAARQDLARRRSEAEAVELALRSDLARAMGGLERLTAQCEQVKVRNDRLETENRRLTLMANALKTELDERIADRLHPLPAAPDPPRVEMPPPTPRRAAPHSAAPRVKPAQPANQYALF